MMALNWMIWPTRALNTKQKTLPHRKHNPKPSISGLTSQMSKVLKKLDY